MSVMERQGTDLRLRGGTSTSRMTSVGMGQVRNIRPAGLGEAGGKGSTLQGDGQVEQGPEERCEAQNHACGT